MGGAPPLNAANAAGGNANLGGLPGIEQQALAETEALEANMIQFQTQMTNEKSAVDAAKSTSAPPP